MDDIDRVVTFCAALDASFPGAVRGADAATLRRIESRMGRALLPVHRRFLELLGADAAWLTLGPFDASAASLDEALAATRDAPPEGFTLFALGRDDPFEDLYLVESEGAEARLELINTRTGYSFANIAPDEGEVLAGSLSQLLCVSALADRSRHVLPIHSVLAERTQRPDTLARFRDEARRRAFGDLWFSNAIACAVTWEDTVIVAMQPDDRAFALSLFGGAAVQPLATSFAQLLDLDAVS
ncbi:hypothetical protein [Sorangium sp. So ce128]|uniref:hypothetical protein n=1 Tax=Sorangium sp. So ce128 TaxID=3133281 RepID=UPI003F603DDB